MAVIKANFKDAKYDVVINPTAIEKLRFYIETNRDVMIITDENVGEHYLKLVSDQFTRPHAFVMKPGENSKNLDVYQQIIEYMIEEELGRDVLVVALGGGVVGDMAGFIASTYMRGVELLMLPTSTLAMVDSCLGGKTALDINDRKNIVGSFYHPSKVLIDPNTLKTLPQQEYNSGLVEAFKAGMIADESLVELMLNEDLEENISVIIEKSLDVKNDIVTQDEREGHIRMLLNLGHTVGHAIESMDGFQTLNHGSSVMLGMLALADNPEVKEALLMMAKKLDIDVDVSLDTEKIMDVIKSDKKRRQDEIKIVYIKEIGKSHLKKITLDELGAMIA